MDYRRIGDVEEGQVGVMAATNDQNMRAQEPPYDASTPLLSTTISNGDDGGRAEQQGTDNSELQERSPKSFLQGLSLFLVSMLPLIIIIGAWIYLSKTDKDPLGFSFISFMLLMSLFYSALAIVLLRPIICWTTLKLQDLLRIPKDTSNDYIQGIMVFMYGLLVTYFLFYLMMCVWANSGEFDDLRNKHGVYHDFQSKMEMWDGLALLTRCLVENAPGRFATVEDFSFCAKDIGVKSG